MAFCSSCGEKVDDGVQFCSKCGKAVGGVAVDNTKPGTKNKLLLAGFIVGALLLISAGIQLILVISNKQQLNPYFSYAIIRNSSLMVIITAVAVTLNILAWIKNNTKLTLATAIVYICLAIFELMDSGFDINDSTDRNWGTFPLFIVPAVLCFIAYGMMLYKRSRHKAA
jgi:uncharacterized membrane protein YvbJ